MKNQKENHDSSGYQQQYTRRRFLQSGTAAASLAIMSADVALGSQSNSKLKLGIIGTGRRGQWIGGLCQQHGGYEIYAAADYFQDRVDKCGEKLGIPPERRFTGLEGYKGLLKTDVDCVAIISPPYFHPEQTLDAVKAGKHVYLAKPIAIDTPGCNIITKANNQAAGKLCFLVDFQTRANQYYIEALKRVHNGELGDIAFGETTFHMHDPWSGMYKNFKGDQVTNEDRLRAWAKFQSYSGDIIVEQSVHTLDVQSWILGQAPLKCAASGGKWMRPHGNCYDTFQGWFGYPNDVGITFSARQMPGHGTKPDGPRNRVFGTKGVLEAEYGGNVMIRGGKKTFYRGGKTSDIYKQGAVTNIADFHDRIMAGKFDNPTVEPSVQSTFLGIMGREAAYTGETVSWEEIVNSKEVMASPPLEGLKA